jgi:hypothetical protein
MQTFPMLFVVATLLLAMVSSIGHHVALHKQSQAA